jgi:hypothetical protein
MRTNARDGMMRQPTKFLAFATCNDEQELKAFRKGFIWDRFTNQEYCPLPDDETMHRILLDKIASMPGGKEGWARLAMNLARRMGVKTPRKIISFLAGRGRLETGEYQRDRLAVQEMERREKPTPACLAAA